MKKALVSLLFTGLSLALFAQNKNVTSAEENLKSGILDKAKTAIDEAITNDKTKDKDKTWYIKGQVYAAIAQSDKYKSLAPDAKDQAFEAFKKCLQINPKYPAFLLSQFKGLSDLYASYWGDGAKAFNVKDYNKAYTDFKNVVAVNDLLYGLNMGMGVKMDTAALLNIGNAAYNAGHKDTAAVYYQKLADIKYKDQPFVYSALDNYYRSKNDEADFLKTLAIAKELFPNDQSFTNEEIDYYRATGKMDELVKKLEDAIAKDPNSYDMNFNLGVAYDNLANPKDAAGNEAPSPANYEDLFNKASVSYKKAITLKPDDYGANFNLGLLYYNRAARIGKKMSALGTSKADHAASDTLSKQQDIYLDDALPYLQKTFDVLNPKPSLNATELEIYKSSIQGMQGIYARKNQTDKYNDLKKKMDAADSKLGK